MNFFLANLALSDLLVLLICLPPTVVNDITKTFWFSSSVCKAIVFFQNTSVYVNILTLVCISFERWKAITSPLRNPLWNTQRAIVLIWIVAMLLSLPEPFTISTYPAVFERPNFTTTVDRCRSEAAEAGYRVEQPLEISVKLMECAHVWSSCVIELI
ncbi:unnamed protein product [Toxocara canis]|uniref:G_PROTEIN_RECEP_F1_2 domain-containing protein n=1 Tax=Toxocara canis TaxID=6265 RepID=A0A183UDW0_TOXCA|nr:unnamed protein product [Toxocara canis]